MRSARSIVAIVTLVALALPLFIGLAKVTFAWALSSVDGTADPALGPILASSYGERCDGSWDNRLAYTAAVAAAITQGRALQFGSGACILGSSVPIIGRLTDMHGQGQGSTIIQSRFDGPAFVWRVDGTNVQNFRIHDMTLAANFATPPRSYKQTTAIKVVGDSSSFFQHGAFDHLTLQGFYAGLTIAKSLPTHAGAYGLGSAADWLEFHSITCEPSTQDGQWCLYFPLGSGTGNTFSELRTFIAGHDTGAGVPSAAIRYEGPRDTTVGDQVVYGSHFGGVHAVFSVAAGTSYRANFLVTASQLDAGVETFADLPADGPVFSRLMFAGNNVGGGVVDRLPPVTASIIDDQLVDRRSAGVSAKAFAASATPTVQPIFQLLSGVGASSAGGASCDVVVNGQFGRRGGVARASLLLTYGSHGFDQVSIINKHLSENASEFFEIEVSLEKGAARIDLIVHATGDAYLNGAQATCTGGTYALRGLF